MREVYILATREVNPIPVAKLREAFETDDVELVAAEDGTSFSVRAGESRTDIRFEVLEKSLGWSPDFLTGSDEAEKTLRDARGFYRISFDVGHPQPSVAVFEALWCARTLMDYLDGVLLDVTAFKLHDKTDVEEITELDFDIRDHVNLHAVAVEESDTPLWVHSHGMEKFGARDLEIFQLAEEDLPPAETFLHQLCTDMAFGNGPPARAAVDAGEEAFRLVPSDEARRRLMGISHDAFENHEGPFLTVLSASGRHNVSELLAPYRQQFEEEDPEQTEQLRRTAKALLPAFKARFLRKGLMEPLSFRMRASFESHPEGEEVEEDLWLEVLVWDNDSIIGKLVDGGEHTTEWRKGAQVKIDEDSVNAIGLVHEGRVLDEDELRSVLAAELPA